jgi:predicted metal-dependent enzyme (double-stranded beta helix superfamily)
MRAFDDLIAPFIAEVKAILAEAGPAPEGLARIAARMRTLARAAAAAPPANEPAGNVHTGRQSTPLYIDETGLTLVRARFGPEAMTPVHNHGSWGVVGVYRGRDRYQVWRRLDGGEGDGPARVVLVEERLLDPGDAVVLPPPPQDIHAQQGADGAPVDELVLFGRNAMLTPRLYFDPAAGTARLVQPGAR